MLSFIKQEIQSRTNATAKNNENEVSNEAILEYSSLFQELDDLSLEGTEAGKERKLSMDMHSRPEILCSERPEPPYFGVV